MNIHSENYFSTIVLKWLSYFPIFYLSEAINLSVSKRTFHLNNHYSISKNQVESVKCSF